MSALCALAEHHLAVHAEGVEPIASEVEALARRATATAPGAAEPLQVLATLRHLQGRPDEALQLLKDSVAMWCGSPWRDTHITHDRLKLLPGASGDASTAAADAAPSTSAPTHADTDDASAAWPPLGARLSAVRLLLELDDSTDLALQVCETCLLEDEDSVEATYLLALGQYGHGALDEAETALDDARILAHEQELPEGHPLQGQMQELGQAIEESRANIKAGGA